MNPYPGLRPFQESEAHLFFGRAAQTDELLGELERSRFVAVLGSSGSGKSSLVKAGLLPALHGGFSRRVGSHWQIATLRPGGNPIHNLARALAAPEVLGGEESDPLIGAAQIEATLRRSGLGLADAARAAPRLRGGRLLVVVDQFEELFRFQAADTGAQGDAAAFVALLIEATGDDDAPVDVILTMRSDFLGDCSQFRDLPETINRGLYLVPRLTRSQLREAITAPAAVGGGAIAPRLVQRLLNDAGANPDLLPVLQHALMRTWDLWAEGDVAAGPVDLEHYEAAGGLEQALARHADEAYDELADDRQRRIAELMFKRLTELGPDRREVRRPCPLDEIAAVAEATPDEVREVIGRFERGGRSFVTVSLDDVADLSDDVVDISHESLIRQWPRLRAWVAEEAESRKVYLRLTSAAERWQRGEAALLRDPDLQVATRWWTDNHPNKAWADRYDPAFERATGFLERSRRAAKRRRIQAVAGVASLALVACAFAILAILAVRARNDARDQQQVARSISLATRASEVFGADPELGLILALRASDASATPQAQEALRQVTNDVRLRRAVQVDDNGVVRAVVFSPDGTRLVTAGDNGRVAAWDPETGGSLGVLVEKGPRLNDVALSPDGAILATADTRGVVRVRDAGDGRVVATLPANPRAGRSPARRPARGVNAVAFGPGGRLVATAGANGQVVLWDWRRDQILGRLGELDGPKVWRVAFSPDGRTLAAAFDDGRIRLWDTSTRAPLKLAAGPHTGPALAVAFSPDGQRLASGGEDGTVRVYDLPGGRRARLFRNQRGFVNDVAFSTGSRLLASAGLDGTIVVQDVDASRVLSTLAGHRGSVRRAVFSPRTGLQVASAGTDGTARVWDWGGDAIPVPAHLSLARSVALSSDGGTAASLGAAGSRAEAKTWSWRAGGIVQKPVLVHRLGDPRGGANLAGVTFVGNDWIAAAAGTSAVVVRRDDAADATTLPPQRDARVSSVIASPDGGTIVVATLDGHVLLWRWPGAAPDGEITSDGSAAGTGRTRAAFFPDGGSLVTGDARGNLRVWDLKLRQELRSTVLERRFIVDVAVSPDGRLIAAATDEGVVRVRDAGTLREVQTLVGHRGPVAAVAFGTLDSRQLVATGGTDGTVRVWDAETGAALVRFDGQQGVIRDVAVVPGGRVVASAADDGTLVFWPCDVCGAIDEVRKKAEGHVTRRLTPLEESIYLGG